MTRLRRDLEIEVPDRLDATIELIIGPCVLSEEQLALAWEAYGDEITGWQHRADASRPWGYWRFALGEEMPRPHWNPETHRMEEKHAETIRLAELGELTEEEIAAIAEKANEAKLRVDTDREQIFRWQSGHPRRRLPRPRGRRALRGRHGGDQERGPGVVTKAPLFVQSRHCG